MHLLGDGERPGYLLVQGESAEKTKAIADKLFGPGGASLVNGLTNRIQYGLLVLGKIPLAEAKHRRDERYNDLRGRLGQLDDEYKEGVRRKGIRPFVDDPEAVLDRKKFATRESNNRTSLAGLKVPKQDDDDDSDDA